MAEWLSRGLQKGAKLVALVPDHGNANTLEHHHVSLKGAAVPKQIILMTMNDNNTSTEPHPNKSMLKVLMLT